MVVNQFSNILVLDDNLADIELLATAWTQAGHDQSIGIHPCTSCEEAVGWLRGRVFPSGAVSGALVDLMLFDDRGKAAFDILAAQSILKSLPIIAWTGIELGQRHTDRMKQSAIRVWKKPGNWTAYADFSLRLYTALNRRSSGSTTRLPIA